MHDHHPGHGDGDPHAPQPDHDAGPASPYEVLERAIRELLIEKGALTADEIAHAIDIMDSRSPALGAQVVARAWADADFAERLRTDTRASLAELDIDIGELPEIRAVFNEPGVHNVIVCTLCSCYPKMLLGIPPAWYKSVAYRSRVVREPRPVLREFGLEVPDNQVVRVHDSTADLRYFVIPLRPPGTEEWHEARLAEIVTRDCMIGTAVPDIAVKRAA